MIKQDERTDWQYSKHYFKEAKGDICLNDIRNNDKHMGFMINLEGASAMKQKELDKYGQLMASAPKMYQAIEQYIKHYDSNETNEEVKQWLDEEGIPMFRQIIKEDNHGKTN